MKTVNSITELTAKKYKHSGVQIGQRHVAPDRQHRIEREGGQHQHQRRQEVHNLVRRMRHNIFLGQRLNSIGERLKKTERPHAIWAVTILNPPQSLALEDGRNREQRCKHYKDGDDREQRRQDWLKSGRRMTHDPLLQNHKELIGGFTHGLAPCWRTRGSLR